MLLESGLGIGAWAWAQVQPRIASFARVCSYDRAGLGFSTYSVAPRTSDAIAGDLHLTLTAAAIRPPYLLVGWSYGGMSMRLFAEAHLHDVAGLVLVDSATENQRAVFGKARIRYTNAFHLELAKCASEAANHRRSPANLEADCLSALGVPSDTVSRPLNAILVKRANSPIWFKTALSESTALFGSSATELVNSRRSLGELPMVVLSAGTHYSADTPNDLKVDMKRFERRWDAAQQQLITYSRRSRREIVNGSTHDIPHENPGAIVNAVRSLLKGSN